MNIEILRAFFGWCTVINTASMLLSVAICVLGRDAVYRMHSRMFPISREAFNTAIYCFIGGMKIIILVFNLAPYLALVIIS